MMAQIPKTDSIEELARFWDTHDVTDFWDELAEVKATVFQRSDIVRVPLTAKEHDTLKKLASTRGLDESTLLHQWVKEKLDQL